jgi:hypothetical protein
VHVGSPDPKIEGHGEGPAVPKTREGRCVSAGDGVVTKVDVSACSALAANAGASELATTTMATAAESFILSCSRDAIVLLLSSTENVRTVPEKKVSWH